MAAYLASSRTDYPCLMLAGHPDYLSQAVEAYALARELLPCQFTANYTLQAAELLQAYGQCYGYDGHRRYTKQQFQEVQQVRSSAYN